MNDTLNRIIALERRVAELEAALNKEATSPRTQGSDDYTCPVCGSDCTRMLGDGGCRHNILDVVPAANRKIRELDECYQELQRCHAENYKNASLAAHREALESAAKMLEELDLHYEARRWSYYFATLVRDHKVTP